MEMKRETYRDLYEWVQALVCAVTAVVLAFLMLLKSSVSAALPRSISATGTTSRSAWAASCANSSRCFKNSILVISPCSCFSRSSSSLSPSLIKRGSSVCSMIRATRSISIFLAFFFNQIRIQLKNVSFCCFFYSGNINILMNKFKCLCTNRSPNQRSTCINWFDGFVNL